MFDKRRVPEKCAFCEEYEYALELKKEYEKEYGYKVYLQARLYEHGKKNGTEKYTHTHRQRALNFCPSCGKKLAK